MKSIFSLLFVFAGIVTTKFASANSDIAWDLRDALQNLNSAKVENILKNGFNPDSEIFVKEFDRYPISIAMAKDDLDSFTVLLKHGADLNNIDISMMELDPQTSHWSTLTWTDDATFLQAAIVNHRHNIDLSIYDEPCKVVINLARNIESRETLDLLFSSLLSFDPNCKTEILDEHVLSKLAVDNPQAVAPYVLAFGDEIVPAETREKLFGKGPLEILIENDRNDLVEILLDNVSGWDVNHFAIVQDPILHIAAKRGNMEMIQLLCVKGDAIDYRQRNQMGETALDIAEGQVKAALQEYCSP